MLLGCSSPPRVGAGPPVPAPTVPVSSGPLQAVPAFDHIFTIVMENHGYDDVIGNAQAPYLNSLASQYGMATNYAGVAHPSLPNYLALAGGSTLGVTSDCTTCFVNAPNIAVDRVAPSGRTWKAYLESMPSPCFAGDAPPYAQKHNPFVYFDDVRSHPEECQKVVPFTQLGSDLASASTTPSYVWVTPNLCNDMHDCPISTGDSWLRRTVPAILGSPAFTSQRSVLFVTFDEDDGSAGNRVATLVIAKGVPPGFRSAARYDHYSMLKTIESSWALAPLASGDGNAAPMSDFFAALPTEANPTTTRRS